MYCSCVTTLIPQISILACSAFDDLTMVLCSLSDRSAGWNASLGERRKTKTSSEIHAVSVAIPLSSTEGMACDAVRSTRCTARSVRPAPSAAAKSNVELDQSALVPLALAVAPLGRGRASICGTVIGAIPSIRNAVGKVEREKRGKRRKARVRAGGDRA